MQSNAERAELWVGAAILLIAGGFLFWSTAGNAHRGIGGENYELRAAFPNVDGIEVGTDVRVAGVKVGRVSAVELNPATYLAEARLRIPGDIKLPTDSAALIQTDGLLGGSYIELQPGGAADNLAPGDEIEDVQGAVSLLSLMMKFVDAQSSEDGK
ncbi:MULTISPECIES: outer membrane lipid asymmetry maintenance protein MlaD [Paracoccus]|jgi:phospholipid/cholesterol/gamma-HCH transport system substrate-binding protein|uniref:Outer membrane lipid asymmetry maintenance protein MlaD n=1 Tax=Paracoccus litorisediminis TaxID=2006130 RepID=A0A844HIB4_9RHOB|nr:MULTISPECIES: outer membrane lipid asymmetry maintenance protein MlaD [Paracoccus]MBD9527952.1 outer membrane lipid asymmetry maintenance protein MlaD [Paracoccus sp. PAR01]MTH59883.1 outer membrane lipid asymmetry maintenance protein MlaD [Paracoccus litorisediminis]